MPTAFETFVNDELPNRVASQETSQTANSYPRYTGTAKLTTERTPAQVLSDIGGDAAAYTPLDLDDWEDADPTTKTGALDRMAGGHAGVVLISPTQPTTPGNGQAWLDTSATGSAGTGVLTVNTITASITLTTSQTVVLCDASTGPIIVTLPAASGSSGRQYIIKKIDSSAFSVTIDADGVELIDGDLTAVITSQYESVSIVCDGSNWHIY